MSETRRSSRDRKKVATIYADALKETEKKNKKPSLVSAKSKKVVKQRKSPAAAKKACSEENNSDSEASACNQEKGEEVEEKEEESEEEEEEVEDEEEEEEGVEDSQDDQESSEEEEEDFKPKLANKPINPRKKTPPKVKKTSTTAAVVALSVLPRNAKRKNNMAKPRAVKSGLVWNSVKKILEQENSQKSLFASLLDTYRPGSTKANNTAILLTSMYQSLEKRGDCIPYTGNTPPSQACKIEDLCRSITVLYSKDPNAAQCQLLNLIFRSIGCSSSKQLSHEVHVLEDMDNDQWTIFLTDLVDDMASSHKNVVLLAADPKVGGSKNINAVFSDNVTPDQQITREYRRIYGELWYVFALVALSSDPSNQEGKQRVSLGTPNRFDAELVRDVILRVTELVSVGQPDIRAAASLAALQMGHAILDRTLHLSDKLTIAKRQYEAFVKQKKRGEKAESLKIQIDTLNRAMAELEELVTGPIVNGIFMHRYRDSHPCIRSLCLASLSKMSCQRPDIFLCDKYLKYFGWLMSDKAECVRYEALGGLLTPFEEARNKDVDTTKLWHVTEKFLPRIADCTLDVCVQVQERAMSMLLHMLRDGFLDEMNDDNIWNQINLRSISPNTSDTVRRDALYFIMEQLEAFDEDHDENDRSDSVKNSRRSSSGTSKTLGSAIDSTERKAVLHLDALASWVAHSLCDGDVPIDEIQIELADLVVFSVRDMPKHCDLMANWGALVRAICEDSAAIMDGSSASDRVSVAKQRILVRFLACAARAEVGSVADASFFSSEDNQRATKRTKQGRNQSTTLSHPHETLSIALLKALPELLLKFRGDVEVLDNITMLPRYLLPSVFSLPQRKQDFSALLKGFSQMFLHSNDDRVLRNTAISLTHFAEGDHSRIDDVRAELKIVAENLKTKVLQHMREKDEATQETTNTDAQGDSSSDNSSDKSIGGDVKSKMENDLQFSLSLAVRKLAVLSKRSNISTLLGGEQLDELVSSLSQGIKKKIAFAREKMSSDLEDGSAFDALDSILQEGLWFMVCCAAWKVKALVDEESLVSNELAMSTNTSENHDDDIHKLITMRDDLIDICEQCFELCLTQGNSDAEFGDLGKARFLTSISRVANQVSSDLRTLFPKEWSQAASNRLRRLAISNEGKLIGGSVRCLRSEEEELRTNGDHEKHSILELLCPLARSLATNWKGFGNRREAGIALSYLIDYDQETTGIVSALSKSFKKTDPVRLLEAHMACLRQLYDEWIDSEPQDIEDDHPTDDQMLDFENAEKAHHEQFVHVEQLAIRLSQSLGVARLEHKLMPAITGFLKEGIRFSFSSDEDGDLILGSRLSFLSLVGKYLVWVRRQKTPVRELGNELKVREENIRAHPEFLEVHEDDIKALTYFREALGLKPKKTDEVSAEERVVSPGGDDEEGSAEVDNDRNATPTQSVTRTEFSSGNKSSSVASGHSKFSSVRSSLSPLQEHHDTDYSDEDSPYSGKKRVRETQSTNVDSSQFTMEGGSQYTTEGDLRITDDEGSEASSESLSPQVKRSKAD